MLIVVLGAYAGYNYWHYHQRNQAARGVGAVRPAAESRAGQGQRQGRSASPADIESKYGGTAYAPMAALVAAKARLRRQRPEDAPRPSCNGWSTMATMSTRRIARMRLAGVLLDEKAYDEA